MDLKEKQTKSLISPLPQYLATEVGRVMTCNWGPNLRSHVTFWLCGHVANSKFLYLLFRNNYGHPNSQTANLRCGAQSSKSCKCLNTWSHDKWKKRTCVYTYTKPMATKLCQVVTYIGGIPSTTYHNLLISWSRKKWKTL